VWSLVDTDDDKLMHHDDWSDYYHLPNFLRSCPSLTFTLLFLCFRCSYWTDLSALVESQSFPSRPSQNITSS
jgi:hypothetical protein